LVGERVTHDASGSDMADDLAMPWADAIVAAAAPVLARAA
jgi:MioC protein